MDPTISGKKDDTVQLGRFYPEKHDLVHKTILIIGPKGSGKTFLTIDLLYHLHLSGVPIGKIINGSEEVTGAFQSIVPSILIDDDWHKESVQKFVDRQKKISSLKKFNQKYQHIDNRAFFVIDDMYYKSRSWIKDPNLMYCFNNGRHIGITLILAIQGLTDIPSKIKDIVDYVFIGRMVSKMQKEYIFKHYSCGFDDYKKFCKTINKGTEDSRFMVFHKTGKKNNFKEQVWWYKAEPHEGLKICSPLVWAWHMNKFDPNYVERLNKKKKQDEMNKKNGSTIQKDNVVLKQ